MPSFYSVVHCVPDPFADERINIGVVVFGDGRVRSRFLQRWDRVERFAGKEIAGHAQAFARRFVQSAVSSAEGETQKVIAGPIGVARIDEARLTRMIADMGNTVQFSPAQSSTLMPGELLDEIARAMLAEGVQQAPRTRDRRHAADLAVNALRSAVTQRFDPLSADKLVKPQYKISGRVVPTYQVSAAVTNGRVYDVVEAFSFELSDADRLRNEIYQALLGFGDMRALDPEIGRFDVLAIRPRADLQGFQEMERALIDVSAACSRAGARLVTDDEADDWAREVVEVVPSSAIAHP